MIHGITFAPAVNVTDSIRNAAHERPAQSVAKELAELADMVDIPKLTTSNWRQWCKEVTIAIRLTGTAAVFVDGLDIEATTTLVVWRQWWNKRLKAADTRVECPPNTGVKEWFEAIVASNVTAEEGRIAEAVIQFWSYTPFPGISIKAFLREFDRRYNMLSTYTDVTYMDEQLRYLLFGRISIIDPQLGHSIRQLNYRDALQKCHKWSALLMDLPR